MHIQILNLASALFISPLQTAGVYSAGGNQVFWYLTRTAGLTAYLLLFMNVVLGLGMTTKSSDSIMARWRVLDLHQFTALLGVAVLGLHVFSLLGDKYFNFGFLQLLVPFAAPYRAGWTALGVIGFYSFLIMTASFYIRRYIGQRTWRTIHYITFGVFGIVLAHGVLTGTDTEQPWARLVYITTGLMVAAFTTYRFIYARKTGRKMVAVRQPVNEEANK